MSKCRMLSFILIGLFAVGFTGCTGSVSPVETGAPTWPALSEDLLTDEAEEGSSDKAFPKDTGSTVEQAEKTEKEEQKEETSAAVDSVQMDPSRPTQQPNGSAGISNVPVDPPLQTQEPSGAAQPTQRQEPEPAKPVQSPAPQTEEPAASVKPSESSREEQPSEPPVPSAPATSEESIPPAAEPSEAEPVIPETPPASESSLPPAPVVPESDTQEDCDRIIREIIAYAESYREKGFVFEWEESMEFGWEVGYMGTPRLRQEGVDGTIRRLKTHIDKIVETGTNPAYGVPSDSVTYKVVQITIDGETAFAVIYGG